MVASLAVEQCAQAPVLTATAFPPWARQHNQPVTYPRLFVEVAGERSIPPAMVLKAAGLRPDLLDDPAGRISLIETWQIFDAVLNLTGDPALGFETGQRLPLTAHGNLGYALMCAPTAREAILILQRFWHLRGRGSLLDVLEDDEGLTFEIRPELPMPELLQNFLFSSMLVSMYRGIGFVMGDAGLSAELRLAGEEPAGFSVWHKKLPPVSFGMHSAQLRIMGDKAALERPLPTANPEGLAHAIAMCERESSLMGGGGDPVLQRTRAALHPGENGYPDPGTIAKALHMTSRTFRRRLQEQGSSYMQLLEEARQRDSCRLLARPELEVQQISELLGYSDPANFTRAFRHWMGKTPREWRMTDQ